ncbi:MAG TPA: lipid-binding protein [Puia sp.]|nr:lipid-binding protein [Puia sp.]
MNKLKIPAALCLLLTVIAGCKKDDTAPTAVKTTDLINEWWVTVKLGDVDELGTHVLFYTYNTSANDDSLWIDDFGSGYGLLKSKVKADLTNLTFSATGVPNDYGSNTVTIANGKVFLNGAKSLTGVVTDSIYMEATFSDDPTDTYIISGVARTRWPDDDSY